MSENELLEENKRLKERVTFLEGVINKGNSGNISAYNAIRLMIKEKTNKEVDIDIVNGQERRWTRERAEKKIMSDLKWDLRVRTVSDFRVEHIEPAKEYINNYVLSEELKKSRWKEEA